MTMTATIPLNEPSHALVQVVGIPKKPNESCRLERGPVELEGEPHTIAYSIPVI